MDTSRASRAGVDPRVRQVGFVTPRDPPTSPTEIAQVNSATSPLFDSPINTSLSPVMIPPPHLLTDRTPAVPVPGSGFRRQDSGDRLQVGSYNPMESLLGSSLVQSPSSRIGIGDGEFSEESNSNMGWFRPSDSRKLASSFPSGGFDLTKAKAPENPGEDAKKSLGASENPAEKSGVNVDHDKSSSSKPLKAKTTKAERRALQEAQRAAKSITEAPGKTSKKPLQKKDVPIVGSASVGIEKKRTDRPVEKDRKKDVPPPRMQFDDRSRVEKAKRRAVVNQTEAKNRVELFRHLPQYEHGSQLPDLESRFFQLESVHPAVYKVGLQYFHGDISGGNARCIAMLKAFQEAIKDYATPPEKTLNRDLTARISSYVSFFIECRPLSVSMGNAIRFIKSRIAKLQLSLSESEAKAVLCADIDSFINEKIILADKVIVEHATTKVVDGDVILIYGSSCIVENILLHAHGQGKQFLVVVVDSRPKLEGQALLRRLVARGLSCAYTHINAVSYIMHEVTRVLLGASAVLSNGAVYSRVGTACVAMVAHAFQVPVLVCCEAYKFHERVQLDSICSNELGDPDAVAKVSAREDVNYLENWTRNANLQLLNLTYDATPSDYVSMIITDYGMIPPTSVPVILREYLREYLLI